MDVELLYFDDCPHWQTADTRLRQVAAEYGVSLRHHRITDAGKVQAFAGSPTILVDGRDPFAGPAPSRGLACRLYETPEGPAGSPTVEQLRAALGRSGPAGEPGVNSTDEAERGERG